ncbi:ABC transporter substrate-binding protein [Pseudonocardia sp.]|jgi:branched-chain amino acid transport system substrate-binding protein|uniref:ABC transporter substrate-binding protein n=1 Tax=Pseudonocardia sp. TaxID=60912 RepID=UPI003D0A713B
MKMRTIFTTCAAAMALALAGCSSGGDSGTGGAGGLTGEPVVIGVQAPTKGTTAAYPQSEYGAQAAEWYINNKMGGINGRPIKLEICQGDGSPETAVNCANQFVSSDVPVVFDANDPSSSAGVPVLTGAGTPIVGELSATAIPDALPWGQAFYFSGPLETSALGLVTVVQRLDKRVVTLAASDNAGSHAFIDKLVQPAAKNLGVSVSAIYTPANSVNFQVLAATALSGKPDVAGNLSLTEDGCTGFFQALRQQGYSGTLYAGSCSQFIAAMKEQAAGAILQPRIWLPASRPHAPAAVQQQLDDFASSMKEVNRETEQSARSLYSFAGMINLANVLKTVQGDFTPESVTTALKAVKDMPSFAGPAITCDGQQWPGRPSACSKKAIFFNVQPDGSLAPVNPDGFIELDPKALQSS